MPGQPHILIVESRYYDEVADELIRGCVATLESAGASFERREVPGAFEIPAAIALAAAPGPGYDGPSYDGYVALGCVIRGETTHYDYVCGESARGLMDLTVNRGLAIGYGIVTVENREQAMERAGVERKNKGRDAAEAALRMVAWRRAFGHQAD